MTFFQLRIRFLIKPLDIMKIVFVKYTNGFESISAKQTFKFFFVHFRAILIKYLKLINQLN